MRWKISAFSVWITSRPGCCPRSWPFPGRATASWTGWPSVRGCHSQQEILEALDQLDLQQTPYKILFLDASDDVLRRRYKETRRRHPISLAENISTQEALAKEREILRPLQDRADYIIDTSLLSTAQNKERICDLFVPGGGAKAAMRLTVMSFGFKFGLPGEADLVLDVRCLPNPFYVPELKHKSRKWWTMS